MNKTKSKIYEIVKEHKEMPSYEIDKMIDVSPDTVAKYLKEMVNEGLFTRVGKGNPWRYYYSIKQDNQNFQLKPDPQQMQLIK